MAGLRKSRRLNNLVDNENKKHESDHNHQAGRAGEQHACVGFVRVERFIFCITQEIDIPGLHAASLAFDVNSTLSGLPV
jgi:hypothetical protein